MDALHILDLVAPVSASTAWLSDLVVMAQARDQLALELATRMHVDGVVDGFVGHGFLGVVGPKAPEFARNLLRRPEKIQLMPDNLKEGPVRMQFVEPPWHQAPRMALRVGQVGIVDAGAAGALELAADRAR